MDTAGQGPEKGPNPHGGGPNQTDQGKYGDFTLDTVREMWTYHAVAAVLRGHSLLAAQREVDPRRVGVIARTSVMHYKNSPAPLTPKQSVRYPGFGLGVEYIPSKHFRLEARGSGMAFKGRSGYYDIEANAVARIKKVEVFGGMKGYHFHTTPHNQDTYTQGTLWGPSFGLRYVIW